LVTGCPKHKVIGGLAGWLRGAQNTKRSEVRLAVYGVLKTHDRRSGWLFMGYSKYKVIGGLAGWLRGAQNTKGSAVWLASYGVPKTLSDRSSGWLVT